MSIDVHTLAWLVPAWLVLSFLVTCITWFLARHRVDAPGWVTACNALLCFFPPLNVLVLALVAAKDVRKSE